MNEVYKIIENGNLELLSDINNLKKYENQELFIDHASKHSHTEIVKFLSKNGFIGSQKSINNACYYNNFELVRFLHTTFNLNCTEYYFRCIHIGGYIDIENYFLEKGLHKLDGYMLLKYGRLEEFKQLESFEPLEGYVEYINCACLHGHLEIVKFLLDKGYKLDVECLYNASRRGYFELVKWIYENSDVRIKDGWFKILEYYVKKFNNTDIIPFIRKFHNKDCIETIFRNIENPREIICMICYDTLMEDTEIFLFKCQHFICKECGEHQLFNKCCICERN